MCHNERFNCITLGKIPFYKQWLKQGINFHCNTRCRTGKFYDSNHLDLIVSRKLFASCLIKSGENCCFIYIVINNFFAGHFHFEIAIFKEKKFCLSFKSFNFCLHILKTIALLIMILGKKWAFKNIIQRFIRSISQILINCAAPHRRR